MARCHSCSAPLAANTLLCAYCGTRNDVDLKGNQNYRVLGQHDSRLCPECEIPLQSIQLDLNGQPLVIERCDQCLGLFFDPNEVEILLTHSVSPVFDANVLLLDAINEDRYEKNKPVKYVKCPVCQFLMNRENFGYRSGVVVDVCRNHGVWLEGGEIRHLLEWKKAGGQLLHETLQAQKAQAAAVKSSTSKPPLRDGRYEKHWEMTDADLLNGLGALIFNLFER